MDLPLYLSFVIAFSSALILPGPNVAFCIAQSARFGFRNSLPVSIGFGAATAVHALVILSGYSAMIVNAPRLLIIMKWLGVSYLLYCAYNALANKSHLKEVSYRHDRPIKLILEAVTVSVTNPKGILASILLYPAFLSKNESLAPQFFILGVTAVLISLSVYTFYLYLGSKLTAYLYKAHYLKYIICGCYLFAALVVSLT